MSSLRTLVYALSLATSATALADVDFRIEGRPYRLVTTPLTWAAAQTHALSIGGELVHIDSAAENAAILAAVQAHVPVLSVATDGQGPVYVWIGGKESTAGNFAWSDAPTMDFWTGGSAGMAAPAAYNNWGRNVAPAEPDAQPTSPITAAAAMAMGSWPETAPKVGDAGQWNAVSADNALAYVVEFQGIYTTIRMSHGGVDKGTFCAKLHYDKAPLAVANFVTLAEGTRSFIDAARGHVVKRPFYNGLIWHRIIPGFMCQGGDPAGNGSSGPGYTFPDQFHPTLRHNKVGVLSLANSGPHTNGSQFFVTVANTTWLDDKHGIFGEVVDGYSTVVQPLSLVPTTSSRPNLPVVMENVTIHRAGTAARAFDPLSQPLASLNEVQATMARDAATGNPMLHWPGAANASWSLLQSTGLSAWANFPDRVQAANGAAVPQTFDVFSLYTPTTRPAKNFFRVAQAVYPNTFQSPTSMVGNQLTVTAGSLTMAFNLSAASTGTWNIVNPLLTGNITDYFWQRTIHGARLRCLITGLSVGGTNVRLIDVPLQHQTPVSGQANLYMEDNGGNALAKLVDGTFTSP